MIRIQLAPEDELESPFWFWPDLAVAIVVGLLGYLAVQAYFDEIDTKIQASRAETQEFDRSFAELKPDIDKFKHLEEDQQKLEKKLRALQSITVSKIARFMPIIVMEHFQNLKPQGVWFRKLEIKHNGPFTLEASSLDNLLVAEMMTSLIATKSAEAEANDLRSQVYFDGVLLEKSEVNDSNKPPLTDFENIASFTFTGRYRERPVANQKPLEDYDVGQTTQDRDIVEF